MPYGAFVGINGVEGLLHISDISWKKIGKVEDVLQPGQVIDVKIKSCLLYTSNFKNRQYKKQWIRKSTALFVWLYTELLGVQFDDKSFVNFILVWKFFTKRHTGQGCRPVVEALFNVWQIECLQFLEGLLEHFVCTVAFTQGDNLASLYRVGRDIYALAINVNQTMINQDVYKRQNIPSKWSISC